MDVSLSFVSRVPSDSHSTGAQGGGKREREREQMKIREGRREVIYAVVSEGESVKSCFHTGQPCNIEACQSANTGIPLSQSSERSNKSHRA